MHRPALPYKFKFKFSGCGNDCVNAIQRSDMAVIGTWRDNIQVNNQYARKYFKEHGMTDLVNDVVARCPTNAITVQNLKDVKREPHLSVAEMDDNTAIVINNHDCVRCVHCLNVIRGGLLPGKDKGVTICIGGKGVLKIGATMGTVIVPFMKLESDEDFEKLNDMARNVLDFFAENALEHERTGEMIDRIGLVNFLEGIGIEIDPNMILHPRTNPYVRMDDWDEQAAKWNERKQASAS
jgi:sulfite reductase alpha subunit